MITQNKIIATQRLLGTWAQTGTGNPVITAIINTMNGEATVNMTRLAAGQYMIQNPPTGFSITNTRINGRIDGLIPVLLSDAALNDFYIQYANAGGNISVDVRNAAGTRVDLSTIGGGVSAIPIDIEIYNTIQTI